MRGRVLCVMILGVTAVVGLSAQSNSGLPYVDIDEATAEIDARETNTAERQQQSADFETRNEELLADILAGQEELLEIDPILARVNAELTELYEVNRTIVDATMRTRSQEAIGRARTIKVSLERQVRSINEEIAAAREEIDDNREQIRINNRRIKENDERIFFLEAAIAQTQAQQARLDAFITNIDSILSDAEQYIEEPAAE